MSRFLRFLVIANKINPEIGTSHLNIADTRVLESPFNGDSSNGFHPPSLDSGL